MSKLKFLVCPEGHDVPYQKWNYARDNSDGRLTYEDGLFCLDVINLMD